MQQGRPRVKSGHYQPLSQIAETGQSGSTGARKPAALSRGRSSTGKQSVLGTQHSDIGKIKQFCGTQIVKTILPRRGGNALVAGGTTGAFRRGRNVWRNAGIAASYRTLEEIAKIARTAKIAKSESGNCPAAANEDAKENACIPILFVL
jgi:hypothetical protein